MMTQSDYSKIINFVVGILVVCLSVYILLYKKEICFGSTVQYTEVHTCYTYALTPISYSVTNLWIWICGCFFFYRSWKS